MRLDPSVCDGQQLILSRKMKIIEKSELVFWLLTVYVTGTLLSGLCDTVTAQYNEKSSFSL